MAVLMSIHAMSHIMSPIPIQLSIVELAAREHIKLAVDADWFRHVDEIISRGFDIRHSFTVFYHAGVESYRVVYDQTKGTASVLYMCCVLFAACVAVCVVLFVSTTTSVTACVM